MERHQLKKQSTPPVSISNQRRMAALRQWNLRNCCLYTHWPFFYFIPQSFFFSPIVNI
jgi:hypothetical protein